MVLSLKRKGAHDSQRDFEKEPNTSQEDMATMIELESKMLKKSIDHSNNETRT